MRWSFSCIWILANLMVSTAWAGLPDSATIRETMTGLATPSEIYGAPGSFGVAYGSASFGVPRTYSEFSSPYGGGYGYGYAPATILPGPYGRGLWEPGSMAGKNWNDPSSYRFYRTFPYPDRPGAPSVPIGYYAPYFGPPSSVDW